MPTSTILAWCEETPQHEETGMSENARRTDGVEVKIGTCEDMYYLRFDQRHQVWPIAGNVDPQRDAAEIRFRFPFPDEDHIAPGDFDDYDRGLVVWGAKAPEIDHYGVQFSAQNGYLVSLPCPEGEHDPIIAGGEKVKIHRNGYGGAVKLVQQRIWGGKLVAVCECKGCGARYRLETLEDCSSLLEGIAAMAEDKRRDYRRNDTSGDLAIAECYEEIARRIVAGYELTL